MALHDLAAVAIRSGKGREAARYARAALEAYGPGHRLLPALAHDIAYFWMNEGFFRPALRVFQALSPTGLPPLHQLCLFSSIARAAGGAGERERLEEAAGSAESIVDSGQVMEGAAGCLLELSRGAASLEMWDRAEEYAQRALALATEHGEAEARLQAEAVLDSVEHGREAEERAVTAKRRIPAPVQALADEFVSHL